MMKCRWQHFDQLVRSPLVAPLMLANRMLIVAQLQPLIRGIGPHTTLLCGN